LKEEVKRIEEETLAELQGLTTAEEIQELRVRVLGKKGSLTGLLRQMGTLGPEERPAFGQIVNEVRDRLEKAWEARTAEVEELELELRLRAERIDISLPGWHWAAAWASTSINSGD